MTEPDSGRKFLYAGIALAVVTAVVLIFYTRSLEQAQQSQIFLRLDPAASVTRGETITAAQLKTIALPDSATSLTTVAIPATAENREWVLGRPVVDDLPGGSLLLFDQFSYRSAARFESTIQPKSRAMSIPVNAAAAVSFFVEPGSRVDIVGTLVAGRDGPVRDDGNAAAAMEQISGKVVTTTILQNVRVLAVGQATTPGAYLGAAQEGYSTVTIEVTPEQAEKLIFAMNRLEDSLTLLLRNPTDTAVKPLPSASWSEVQRAQ
jgi:Flp pilus assembly protein CpaB